MRFLFILGLSLFSFSILASDGLQVKSCEIAFAKMMGGRLSSEATGTNKFNLWDKGFEPETFMESISKSSTNERIDMLRDLARLADKSEIYNQNLANLAQNILKDNLIPFKTVKQILEGVEGSAARFFVSQNTKSVRFQIEISPEKIKAVDDFIKTQKLSKNYTREYRDIFLSSNRTEEDLKAAIEAGMKLRQNAKDLEQFRSYIEFIENSKPKNALKAMKEIESIYDYAHKPAFLKPGFLEPTYKQFLNNQHKVARYEEKRLGEILDEMRKQDNLKIVKEVEELEALKRAGKAFDEAKLNRLKSELSQSDVRPALRKRALAQAKGEAQIYQKLRSGCSSGKGNKKLDAAKKKFKKFKLALSIAGTPFFYYMKNKDKMETDPFWYERLGYEMGMGLVFTFVGNKIVTGTNTSFWQKYMQGQIYGAGLDLPNSVGYDMLFGKHGYARYIKKVYSGEFVENEAEKEFEKLKNSPTFKQDVAELYAYLEEKSQDLNTKNILNKYFNLSAYESGSDATKITQEDLESEEAKEMMIELLAERMYLKNMGQWPIFQTGSSGADRWGFYRMTNIPFGLKGLIVDLAIFRVLCTEPLGPIGSFGLAMGIVFADKYIFGDLTYEKRREAINQ